MDGRTVFRMVAHLFRRVNQVTLSFPVWLVLGISSVFKRSGRTPGWERSEENDRYGAMY